MKSLIEFIAKSIVDDPTEVWVTEENRGRDVQLELTVAEEDMGRVIGKQGKIINALRLLLKAKAIKLKQRVRLELAES